MRLFLSVPVSQVQTGIVRHSGDRLPDDETQVGNILVANPWRSGVGAVGPPEYQPMPLSLADDGVLCHAAQMSGSAADLPSL